MTDDEQCQITNKTLGDLARAEKRLAYLRCKAKQIADDISLVVAALRGEKVGNQDGGRFRIYEAPQGLALDGEVSWPSVDEIGRIFRETDETERKITDLMNRKESLGF